METGGNLEGNHLQYKYAHTRFVYMKSVCISFIRFYDQQSRFYKEYTDVANDFICNY